MTPTRRNNPFAFTLMELVLSMGIMVILVGATTSAVLMSSHALPDGQSPSHRLVQAGDVLDRMAGELVYANSVTKIAANGVVFTVDDRNHGDPGPETIRYEWSGTPGDPLTRQYNGGTVVTLLDDVRAFELSYALKPVTKQSPPSQNESTETLLISHDTPAVPLDFAITDKEWIGQYFFPPLPADATAWKVTRVKFVARVHGATKGITAVQLRLPATDRLPSATVLEQVLMNESDLMDSYTWQEFSFSSVSGLSPAQGLCLALTMQQKDTHLADIQYDDGSGSGRLTTTDKGVNWNYDSDKSMLYAVYGTVTTPGTPVAGLSNLTGVSVRLEVGEDPSVRAQTVVEVLNAPEVSGL